MLRRLIAIIFVLTLASTAVAKMNPTHIRDGQPELLLKVVELAKTPKAVVVFDLDSTLYDPRPRYVAIIKEYGKLNHLPKTQKVDATKVESSWFTDDDLIKAGIPKDKIEDFRKFWKDRFFTSEYVIYDTALPGAADYVNQIYKTGARVVYQSGRNEKMRDGTMTSLKRDGFPTGDRTDILLKPDVKMPDPEFKQQLVKTLKSKGKVIALFDNEPENVNIFADGLPGTLVIFVNTDHSFKKIEPKSTLPWVDGFLLSAPSKK